MSRPGQLIPVPPVDFPVYGLDDAWPGARWLESFGVDDVYLAVTGLGIHPGIKYVFLPRW
jgi:hypothetical protein